jgi:hypothetical protein
MNRITAIAFIFTAACGGVAFTAGEQASFDGGSPELDGGIDTGFDKGSTDGGSAVDSAGLDGGFVEVGAGDAAVDACFAGTAHWCTQSGGFKVMIQPGEYCRGDYAAADADIYTTPVTSLTASAIPPTCICTETCECISQTNPCGQSAFIECTGEPAYLMVRCDAK